MITKKNLWYFNGEFDTSDEAIQQGMVHHRPNKNKDRLEKGQHALFLTINTNTNNLS